MDETFSSIDLITQCLTDEKRTLKFKQAIEEIVKPGDVVLDAGTGSSILALFAARAGAKQVIAVEFDPYVAKLAQQNIANNNYENTVQLMVGDAREIHFEEKVQFDVVIMEMLTTGMIDEHQVLAINNLHKGGYIKELTIFIPKRQNTYIALSEMDFTTYGLKMRMVRHLWEPFPVSDFKQLTDTILLNSISFNKQNPTTFSGKHEFEISKEGILNSIYFTGVSVFSETLEVADTLSLNAPVVFPLDKDYVVQKGDHVACTVDYEFGRGFRNVKVEVRLL